MKKILLILLLFPIATFSQWSIINSPIRGEAQGDLSGWAVSMSGNGNILAIGAPRNDGGGSNSGHVRVYNSINGNWTQIGSDINGTGVDNFASGATIGGAFSRSVSLNADGSIVAIGSYGNNDAGNDAGHVRIFQNISGNWTQLGQSIQGNATNDRFGLTVDLNASGTRIAIGGNNGVTDTGVVRIYELNSNTWTQLGNDILPESSNNQLGYGGISLNSNGNIVAIGARFNNGGGSNSGHVRVFVLVNSGTNWQQIGSDIDGDSAGDQFGTSVSINAAGNIFVAGAPFDSNGSGSQSGQVRVFQNVGNAWTQVGSDIDGEASLDEFGGSVDISADGLRIALGGPGFDLSSNGNSFSNIGQVRVFDNVGGNWVQAHNNILGCAAFNRFGTSVSISDDGNKFIGGAPYNAANGQDSGQGRIYQDTTPLSIDNIALENEISFYPIPASDSFIIKSSLQIIKVLIYDVQGKLIKILEKEENDYSIKELTSGIYFANILTDKGTISKKIVKK